MTSEPIRILTYNISWQSMVGQAQWKLCNNSTDPNSPRHFSKCIQNVTDLIDSNGPYDIVCLQEASNYKKIISKSKILKQMSMALHKSGPEFIVTFWNKNTYHLIKEPLQTEFFPGRPIQVLEFDNHIKLINIHAGHFNKSVLVQKLSSVISSLGSEISDRIIIAGDFNTDIEPIIKIAGILFYTSSEKKIPTCCGPGSYTNYFDHVLDSAGPPIKIISPNVNPMASDHRPILATLEPTASHTFKGGKSYYDLYVKYKYKYLNLQNQMAGGTYCDANGLLSVTFDRKKINHEEFIDLSLVQHEPTLKFDKIPGKLYTIIMVDPDAPSNSNPIYRNWLHWMIVNTTDTIAPFHPSNPSTGTGKHRYYFYLFEQKYPIKKNLTFSSRQNFDLELFVKNNELKPISCVMYMTERTN